MLVTAWVGEQRTQGKPGISPDSEIMRSHGITSRGSYVNYDLAGS